MSSRKAQREELERNMIVLPNINGRMMSQKERADYFKFVRMERKRIGKDPSASVIAALHQADALLKQAEEEKNHPSKEDIESAINDAESSKNE